MDADLEARITHAAHDRAHFLPMSARQQRAVQQGLDT